MLTVTHAYSRVNAGDGLLVDLSLDRIRRAVGPVATRIVAVDPSGFEGDVIGVRSTLLTGALSRGSQGFVAVGGGYLRADSAVGAGKLAVAHLSQLARTARSSLPAVYLPQSIGPLPGPLRPQVLRWLRAVDRVYVRDDRSADLLSGLDNVVRCPDLAVLELGRTWTGGPASRADGPVVLVARDLADGHYDEQLRRLSRLLPDALWAVQSEGRGNDDTDYYARLGVRPAGRLVEVLSAHPRGVVVSVRLHGALQALLAGWPAVHLSYERKGWGAYEDLGVPAFVHGAGGFSPEAVVDQVADLRRDPVPYFAAVDRAVPRVRASSDSLDADLHGLYTGVSA